MDVTASSHSSRPSFDNRNAPQSRGDMRPVVSSPRNQIVRSESTASAAAAAASSPLPATVVESSSADNRNGPKSRGDVRPVVSSPRTQIVRAESNAFATAASSPLPATVVESSSAAATSSPADDSSPTGDGLDNVSGSNGNTAKRPAWNSPSSNGAPSDVKLVIDASSWPALSKSTRATVKLSSESSKSLTDGSSALHSQGIRSPPSSSERQVTDNAKTSTPVPTSQKPTSPNGSNVSSNGSHQQQSGFQGPTPATGSRNSSPKDNTQRSGYGSQTHNVTVRPQHHHQRDSFKTRNGGPNQRGDGARQHNHWGRREQNRGNQDWNIHRSFNGRDIHMPPRGVPRFTRPLPPPPYSSAQYLPPPPVPPYGGTYGFPELGPQLSYYAAPPPEPFSGVPYMPPIPPHPVYFPAPDPELYAKIVKQIEYYFSFANLIKDMFLRKHMDDQGWVPIRLIAGFQKVMELTDNIQIIRDALQTSSVVEILGDKIRRRDEWQRWIIPASFELLDIPGSPTLGTLSQDKLAEQVQSISLEEKTNNDGVGESYPSTGERTDQVGSQC